MVEPAFQPTITCSMAATQSETATSRYAFLQILHGLGRAPAYVDNLLSVAQSVPGFDGLATNSTLSSLAFSYLWLQGAEAFEIEGVRYPLETLIHMQDPWVPPPIFTMMEQCVVCCHSVSAWNNTLRLVNPPMVPNATCPYLNISRMGLELVDLAAEGVYELQNYTAFNKPVWKQEPGDLYIYFLPATCFADHCGDRLNETVSTKGPAWVGGARMGSQHYSFYALNPYDMLPQQLQGSYSQTNASIGQTEDVLVLDEFVPTWLKATQEGGAPQPQNIHVLCMSLPLYRNATIGVSFADPTAHRKVTMRDVNGTLVSTGNLRDITSMGVLVSPILAANSPNTATRIKFGVGWQSVKIQAGVNDALNSEWMAGGLTYCTIPRQSCLLPAWTSAFSNNMAGCVMPFANAALRSCFFDVDAAQGQGEFALDAFILTHREDSCVSVYATSEYLNATTGRWEMQRFHARSPFNLDPSVGSTIVLDDWPGTRWNVTAVHRVCHEDALGDQPGSKCLTSNSSMRIMNRYTTRKRFVLCNLHHSDLVYPLGAQSASTARLLTAIPVNTTNGSKLVVRLSNNTWGGVRRVRVANETFNVVGNAGDMSGYSLELARTAPVTSSTLAYPVGSLIFALQGDLWNVMWTQSIVVPAGVYSLENMTEYIHSHWLPAMSGREARLTLTLREPGEGLCGEVPHGVSYESERFHCTHASRYFQLQGEINATRWTGASNHIKVFNTSSLLPALGIARPVYAYVFSHVQTTQAATRNVVRHPSFPGAGYVSSGHGRDSGYGMAGEDKWNNFMPPNAGDQEREPKTLWCRDGAGYVCQADDCACRTLLIVTPRRVLGATRTQSGEAPRDNTLLVPRTADGVFVSTGNLEDVGLDSSAATSVSIDALREHATAVAARVHGKVEFGQCNDMFGNAADRCEESTSLLNGMLLGDDGRLAVHTYWDTRVWVAFRTLAGDPLQVAAFNRNTQEFWKLVSMNRAPLLRTYATVQDQMSLRIAGRVCTSFCEKEELGWRESASSALARAADLLQMFNVSIETIFADTNRYCAAIKCPVAESLYFRFDTSFLDPPPMDTCSSTCSRVEAGVTCVCALNSTFREQWQGRPRTYEGNADVWETVVKLWEFDASVTTTSARNAKMQRASSARWNYTQFVENPTILSDAKQAAENAKYTCMCIEAPGVATDMADNVVKHACPVQTLPMQDDLGREVTPPQNVSAYVCESLNPDALSVESNGTSSVTVLKFERNVHHPTSPMTHHLSLPSATGILLTTGNLHSLTAESGSMTSVYVKQHSTFHDNAWIGAVNSDAKSRGSRVRYDGRTTRFTDVSLYCEACRVSGTCDVCEDPSVVVGLHNTNITVQDGSGQRDGFTMLSFSDIVGAWNISFPAWDDNLCAKDQGTDNCIPRNRNQSGESAGMRGTVITTGNLADITYISPNFMKVLGEASLDGSVEIGSSYDCTTGKYWRSGWTLFSQAQCAEVQHEVLWNSTKVLALNSSECKKACEQDLACGVAVVNTTLDRRQPEPACLLFRRRATTCTVEPNPLQDLYLLVREGPSPWLTREGNASFFEPMCKFQPNNLTQIPASEIKLEGFLHGGMMWRPAAPLSWKPHPKSRCQAYRGHSPEILQTMPYSEQDKGASLQQCKDQCEMLPGCKVVTVMRDSAVCTLSSGISMRRTLAEWDMIQGSCWLEPAEDSDVHMLVRAEDHVRFQFQPPTKKHTLTIPDASGVIITSGNTYDMLGGIGLAGDDNIIYVHKESPRPFIELDENLFKDPIRPNELRSWLRGKAFGFHVWGCERLSGCNVTASTSIDDEILDELIQVSGFCVCVCVSV